VKRRPSAAADLPEGEEPERTESSGRATCTAAGLGAEADRIPDARDGLSRVERIVLLVLAETERELGGRNVPMAMLYGRVAERIDLSRAELMSIVRRLAGKVAVARG